MGRRRRKGESVEKEKGRRKGVKEKEEGRRRKEGETGRYEGGRGKGEGGKDGEGDTIRMVVTDEKVFKCERE